MISYVRGELTEIIGNVVVIESAGGIGMNIVVPESVLSRMPVPGSEIKVYTYLNVKEDSMTLYGFLNRDDLNIFRLLLTVNGIGPKGALGILSTIAPDDLRFAVLSDDVKAISAAPGIGAKTAQRLIIELKDKLRLDEAYAIKRLHGAEGVTPDMGPRNEAVQALVALGYGRSEAAGAVNMVDGAERMESEELLREALRKLALI